VEFTGEQRSAIMVLKVEKKMSPDDAGLEHSSTRRVCIYFNFNRENLLLPPGKSKFEEQTREPDKGTFYS
jgi:hypothetical protein